MIATLLDAEVSTLAKSSTYTPDYRPAFVADIMSKGIASPPTPGVGSLKSPPDARVKLNQNGSALPLHLVSVSPGKQKSRDDLPFMDPDEVFEKHSVHEVKSILHKLRSDVDAKQEELRLMVGERYRDLLQASTSIISMSQTSKQVVDAVARMQRIVTTDLREENLLRGVKKGSDIDDTQLKIYQCLAAHLKFLVDAPEHLWRLLERKQCLSAAWLFLLSRVVYRSLMNEDSEEGQDWVRQGVLVKEQFPLVQRQWEAISQFRTQISHKATLSLREQNLRPENLCASIFTLHLLDSLPLSDALDVFLKQRSRTLQNLYQNINESWERPSSGKDGAKTIWTVLRSVLDSIVRTVGNGRAVLGEPNDGLPSMIDQLLVFTQRKSIEPIVPLPAELCLSSHILISSLPNSSHFQYLPSDIKSYRPFIDLDSPSSRIRQETLNSKLRAWFTKATEQLHELAGSWLSSLETAKTVWELRSTAMDWLSASSMLLGSEDMEALRLLVDDLCKARVEKIWNKKLEEISSLFRNTLQSADVAIIEDQKDAHFDVSPAEYLLSAPPAPSVTQASLNVPLVQNSFQRFKHGIQQRMEGVTPFIHKIMSDAESSALSLCNDLNHAFASDRGESLESSYVLDSDKAAHGILDSVQNLLSIDDSDSGRRIRRLYFLARLSRRLSLSPLVEYLRCSLAFSDRWRVRACQIYDLCVEEFSSMTALSARHKFLSNLTSKARIVHPNSSLPSSPSPELMDALLCLVASIDKLVQSKDVFQRSSIAKIVLSRFSNAATEPLLQPTIRAGLELVWDLYFLKAICDGWGEALSESTALLDQTVNHFYQSLPSDVEETYPGLQEHLQRTTSQSIRHFHLLLSPLLAPSDVHFSTRPSKSPSAKFPSQGPSGMEQGVQPMINLVKPSPRFGLLWVASNATQ